MTGTLALILSVTHGIVAVAAFLLAHPTAFRKLLEAVAEIGPAVAALVKDSKAK